jgi:DNA repair protein RadC
MIIHNAKQVNAYIRKQYTIDNEREKMFFIMLDDRHHLIGTDIIGIGSTHQVTISSRHIIKTILQQKIRVSNIILVHNHPRTRVKDKIRTHPSKSDIELSMWYQIPLAVLGVKILDSIILYDNTYKSYQRKVATSSMIASVETYKLVKNYDDPRYIYTKVNIRPWRKQK